MRRVFTIPAGNGQTATLITDPLDQYQEAGARELIEACGLLPGWLIERNEGETMAASIERQYAFYGGQMTGGKVQDDGVYTFPGDSDLHPYASVESEDGERAYIYPYAILAIIGRDGERWISRCD